MTKFRLNEFRDIARWLDKKLPGPLAFFLKGWLYGLESSYINAKAVAAIEKGIAPFTPSDPVVEPPTYHSEPSEVEGLDIINLTNGFSKK
jgi:hypothetical protein